MGKESRRLAKESLLVMSSRVKRETKGDPVGLVSRDIWSGKAAPGRGSGSRWEGEAPFVNLCADPLCTLLGCASLPVFVFEAGSRRG